MVDWSNNDHSKYYTPVSIDTVGDQEGLAECVVLALQESCVEEQVASAFPVGARQEEVVEAGTLDEGVDLNEFLRVGGFAPVQWVLGRLPRGVGHVLDEEELGQLGVLAGMQDPSSAFGRRAGGDTPRGKRM